MAAKAPAAQNFVPIREVRDGIMILKDGSMRAIVLVSSINFALKSEDEQVSILLQFQTFLNSLDFPIQIFIQSRRLDIRPYLALLENRLKEQVEELMKIQTREYIEFIKNFTETTSIMQKSFFIVIPYAPPMIDNKHSMFGKLFSKNQSEATSNEQFEEQRTQLEQRISVVQQGITRSGLRVAPLGTEEIIELFYKLFNPGELEKPIKLS